MEKKLNKWTKGKRSVATFLIATTVLLSNVPAVQAEDSQPSAQNQEITQSPTEEIVTPDVVRYEGRSRENVAENVAEAHFSDSNKVIIVNREKFPDAISATNISQGDYPVLYTRDGRVSDSTMELLESMPLDEIYVLGGNLSVNESVVEQLEEAIDVEVTRVAGRSRYDANVSAVEENFNQANHVVIASGEVYSDALYGVSYANTVNSPVVLTNTNRLETSTIELLEELGVEEATIIGGPLTVTDAVEDQLSELGIEHTRIAGRNRYIGSAEVAAASYEDPENVVVASGEVFSDALVSAPLAQKLDAPILLVRENRMEEVVEDFFTDNRLDLESVYIQGGPLTISPTIEQQIEALTTYEKETIVVPTRSVTERHDTIEEEEDSLPEGETEVVQEGKDGYLTIFYEVVYIDGKEASRVEIGRTEEEAVTEIIRVGTQTTEVEEETVTEIVPFETVEVSNFNAFEGETEVVQEGVNGTSENTYAVTYVNGVETDRELIDSNVTVEPVDEVIAVGVLPETITDEQVAPDGMTLQIDDITFTEGEQYNTFTIEYTETNNTEGRVAPNAFKLYLSNGDDQIETDSADELMPGDSVSGSVTFRLLKSETPEALEYGDVSLNEDLDPENPSWTFGN